MQRERELPRSRRDYADGCLRISARACKRFASAGLFADAGTLFDRWRHALQLRHFAFVHVRALRGLNRGAQSCDAVRGQRLRTLHLIEIGLGDDQLRRPLELLLVLHIQHGHADGLGRVNFVLREEFASASVRRRPGRGQFPSRRCCRCTSRLTSRRRARAFCGSIGPRSK